MDIGRTIASQQPPIPLPDFKAWKDRFNQNSNKYSASKPTISSIKSESIPSINHPSSTSNPLPYVPLNTHSSASNVPVSESTDAYLSVSNASTSNPPPYVPTKPPRSVPTTIARYVPNRPGSLSTNVSDSTPTIAPRPISTSAPTNRAFQDTDIRKNTKKVIQQQKQQSIMRRRQNVNSIIEQKQREHNKREQARLDKLVSGYKQKINNLQHKISDMQNQMESIECGYVLKIAELEEQLQACRNMESAGNNHIEIDVSSGNKKKIIINISAE